MTLLDVLIGLHLYDTDPVSLPRQRRAVGALDALRGVQVVNLQFEGATPISFGEIEPLAVLRLDSTHATGIAGRRKPLTREVFDVLAGEAARRGLTYFAYINNDILVRRSAIDLVRAERRQAYVFSRGEIDQATAERLVSGRGTMDTTRTSASSPELSREVAPSMMTAGQDMFVIAVDWWARHRGRFRHYALGEGCWDNVYTAILMCHSDGLLLNREPHILHETHVNVWHAATPAACWNGMLAALDARYFSLWCEYWVRLEALRSESASIDEEQALRDTLLRWRPSTWEAALQVGRSVKARSRYRRLRRTWRAAEAA